MTRRPATAAWVLALCTVGVLAAQGTAWAAVQWYEHYEAGLRHEAQGRWAEAVAELRVAARRGPQPRPRINTYGQRFLSDYDPFAHLARCHLELGQLEEAARTLSQAERFGVTPRAELDRLRARLEAARRSAPTPAVATPTHAPRTFLIVTTEPPGALVALDGVPMGASPVGPRGVEPGRHLIRVELDGFTAVEQLHVLEAGRTVSLSFPLTPLALSAAEPSAAPAASPATPFSSTSPGASTPTPAPAAPLPPGTVAGRETSTAQPATAASPTVLVIPPERHGAATWRRVVVTMLVIAALVAATVALKRRRSQATTRVITRVASGETTQIGVSSRLGRYDIFETLGRGGMAVTYRAARRGDGATVALKVPHEGCLADESFRTRFLREGQLGQQLHHPNIVRVLDAGEDSGRLFLAMELLSGQTLKRALCGAGFFELRRAIEIVRAIAEALDYAHAKGVIHRDLKPENVMLLPDGGVKVMDFGIARVTGQTALTGTNFFLGTPLYSAPEAVDAKNVDHRADLYALGIILFELIEGTVPFSSDSPFRVMEMHIKVPLPDPATLRRPMPAQVWTMVSRLCAKDREARYPDASALLVDLNRVIHDLPG